MSEAFDAEWTGAGCASGAAASASRPRAARIETATAPSPEAEAFRLNDRRDRLMDSPSVDFQRLGQRAENGRERSSVLLRKSRGNRGDRSRERGWIHHRAGRGPRPSVAVQVG